MKPRSSHLLCPADLPRKGRSAVISTFANHQRARFGRSELVAKANPDIVRLEIDVRNRINTICQREILAAEVGVAIFDPSEPLVGEGVLNAGSNRPANMGFVVDQYVALGVPVIKVASYLAAATPAVM